MGQEKTRAKSHAEAARFSVFQRKQDEAKRKVRSHFNASERDCLVHVYNQLAGSAWSNGSLHMSQGCLRTVLYLVMDMPERQAVVDRITAAVCQGDAITYVSLPEWLQMMSLFLRGTADERMRFCYRCYDRLRTGQLEPDSIMRLMRGDAIAMRTDMDQEEMELELQGLVDILMAKLDVDRDGAVSWNDYCDQVRRQPLLMECFGRCIPDRDAVAAFLMTFSHRTWKF